MSDEKTKLDGPDLSKGVVLTAIADGTMLLGHAQGEPVILVRRGNELFAIGAVCTHYGAPLAEGLLVEDTVRCPWHHACFSLHTGAALRAPALQPIVCWRVEKQDGVVYVRERRDPQRTDETAAPATLKSIIIVGSGGAGNAAAEMLRQEGYAGDITMVTADASLPYDRPNLSKGTLAGTGAAEVTPPHSAEFYQRHAIGLRLNTRVTRIHPNDRQIELEDGSRHVYDALLLATGADPIRLDVPGADLPHVRYLRTSVDCDALIGCVKTAKRAVVIGASFIGLEVASSLRAGNLEVHVVGRETALMEKVLGAPVGAFLRRLHEDHGVVFHLGTTPSAINAHSVTLANGETLDADLVVVGIGVRPATELAEQAGLEMDRGVTVDEYLETSTPGIFAAGDIARWPDRLTGERIRVEHWVVAERQGQTAARNMLGLRERFDAVPFFWTEQYDFGLAYVGHAEGFDRVEIDGSLEAKDCKITYRRGDKTLATAFVHRDLAGLHAEVEFERAIAAGSRIAD